MKKNVRLGCLFHLVNMLAQSTPRCRQLETDEQGNEADVGLHCSLNNKSVQTIQEC